MLQKTLISPFFICLYDIIFSKCSPGLHLSHWSWISVWLGAVAAQTRTPRQLEPASCSHAGFVLAAEGWTVPDPCGDEVTHRGYKEARGHVLSFLLAYISELTATLLTWQMDPTSQPPTQPCCVWHGAKGTLREQNTRNLLQRLARCQVRVCQLF